MVTTISSHAYRVISSPEIYTMGGAGVFSSKLIVLLLNVWIVIALFGDTPDWNLDPGRNKNNSSESEEMTREKMAYTPTVNGYQPSNKM